MPALLTRPLFWRLQLQRFVLPRLLSGIESRDYPAVHHHPMRALCFWPNLFWFGRWRIILRKKGEEKKLLIVTAARRHTVCSERQERGCGVHTQPTMDSYCAPRKTTVLSVTVDDMVLCPIFQPQNCFYSVIGHLFRSLCRSTSSLKF